MQDARVPLTRGLPQQSHSHGSFLGNIILTSLLRLHVRQDTKFTNAYFKEPPAIFAARFSPNLGAALSRRFTSAGEIFAGRGRFAGLKSGHQMPPETEDLFIKPWKLELTQAGQRQYKPSPQHGPGGFSICLIGCGRQMLVTLESVMESDCPIQDPSAFGSARESCCSQGNFRQSPNDYKPFLRKF